MQRSIASPPSCKRGEFRLAGRTEAEVSADLGARIIAEGHQRVNFAIVAAGENAASPHHHASDRVIHEGEIVLCDFGGTMDGYCSDITRCVFLGDPPAEVAEAYAVLLEAQRAAVLAGIVGTTVRRGRSGRPTDHHRCRLRRVLHAPHRPRHRHGRARGPLHGRGQRPAARARTRLQRRAGDLPAGRWGMRLEDIVVATDAGPLAVNDVDHALVSVDA